MENFVQVRFATKKMSDAFGMVLHNTRKIAPNYLRTNQAHNKESNTIFLFEQENTYKYDISNERTKTKVNNLMKLQLQEELQQCKTNSKNFREKKHAVVIDSVITLSNSINDMYKKGKITKEDLNKLFLDSVRNLEKELHIKALNLSIHYDEKTPHAHVSYRNYENGKSKFNGVKKQFEKSQDIVGNVFGEIGFRRGIKKSITNAKHLNIVQMHEKERELLELKKQQLKEQIKQIESDKERLIQEYSQINSKTAQLAMKYEEKQQMYMNDKTLRQIVLNNLRDDFKSRAQKNYDELQKQQQKIEQLKNAKLEMYKELTRVQEQNRQLKIKTKNFGD